MKSSRDYQLLSTYRIILLTVTFVLLSGSPSGSVSSDGGLLPCSYSWRIFLHGESVIIDKCTTCTCHNSTVKCEIKGCPPTFCDDPVIIEEECCDICPYYVPVWKVIPKNIDVITEGIVNDLIVDLNVKINDEGQSVNGDILWKVGVWASATADGSGVRVGYRENILTKSKAAKRLVRPPLSGGFEFNINYIAFELNGTDRTCREMKFLCMKFGEADNPELKYPQLPFTVEGVEDEYDATPNPQNVIGCERFPKCEALTRDVTNMSHVHTPTQAPDVLDQELEILLNETRSVVSRVDDIINSYDDDCCPDGSVPESPNQIQRALERRISTLQTQAGNTTIDEDNVAIRAVKVPVASLSDGKLVFDMVTGDKGENSTMISIGGTPRPNAEVAISFQLPQDILDGFSSNGSLPISFIVYQNDKLFPSLDIAKGSNEEFRREVGGRIISATVETVEVIHLPPEKPVELHFTINKEGDDKIENITCVFWDNKASNGLGDWSPEGCYQYQNQSEHVICHCNHLTSFAVLVDRFKISSYVLDIISKIGCGVSISCLVLALVTYLSSKEIRARKEQQIFISFCISLVSLYVIFLVGIERTNPQWGCTVVSILLHYFTLTTIPWMAVEAFTTYVNLVQVAVGGVPISRFMLKASLLAWGVPAVVVAIIAVGDFKQYRNTHCCFINIDYPFYFTQVLLLTLTIFFNGYTFIRVMYKLSYGREESSKTRETNVASKMKKRAWNACCLSSLLGLTWVFGLLSLIHEDATLTFQVLFCVFNSLQGLFVFIMFCVLNHDIRAIWKEFCCKGSSDVPLYSSSTGKTRSSTVPNYNKKEMEMSQM